jgi:hypothetical protein
MASQRMLTALLEGLEALAASDPAVGIEAAVAITAHLLGLLVTLIGEPLTVRLVRDAWPDTAWDKVERG